MAATAEGVEAGASAEEGGKSGKGSSKLLLIGLLLALIIGGAAGAYFTGMFPSSPAPPASAGTESGNAPDPTFAETVMVPLDPFVANLGDQDGGRYIKTTMQLEFAGSSPPAWLEQRVPQIRDLILTLLTSKTFDEIRSPEGKQILRDEIILRANQALQSEAVHAVYFTEFIIQ